MVPTEAELAQLTGASMATEATVTLKEEEAAPKEVVTKAPTPAATEAAGEETGAPSAHTEVPVEKTEATSIHTEAQTEQTDSPLAHTEAPAQETEAPLAGTEAPAENAEADVQETTATEETPEVTEAANKSDAPETRLPGTSKERVLEAEADQVMETERDKVEVEDSEGEILTQTYIYSIWQMLLSKETLQMCYLA